MLLCAGGCQLDSSSRGATVPAAACALGVVADDIYVESTQKKPSITVGKTDWQYVCQWVPPAGHAGANSSSLLSNLLPSWAHAPATIPRAPSEKHSTLASLLSFPLIRKRFLEALPSWLHHSEAVNTKASYKGGSSGFY